MKYTTGPSGAADAVGMTDTERPNAVAATAATTDTRRIRDDSLEFIDTPCPTPSLHTAVGSVADSFGTLPPAGAYVQCLFNFD